jgi:hypothetical protein
MRRRDLLALTPALLLPGCSSSSKPAEPKKPAEPVTGLHAVYQMYSHARTWAPDIKVLRCSSIDISQQVPPQPGKAGAWQVIFASETRGQKRPYTFSVYEVSVTLREGIYPETPSSWSNDNRAFLMAAVKIDTDEAWKTALQHAEEYNRKNPNIPISYTLELGRNINDPIWRVIWGESAASSAYSVLVDASTGAYLETLH